MSSHIVQKISRIQQTLLYTVKISMWQLWRLLYLRVCSCSTISIILALIFLPKSVKYPEAQPTGTFSRGKELPHRQPSHDV